MKSTSEGRARHRNRSGVVELVGREPLPLDHRESRERRDKIFAAKTESAKIFKTQFGSGKQFSVGILAAGKIIFWGGYNFKTG